MAVYQRAGQKFDVEQMQKIRLDQKQSMGAGRDPGPVLDRLCQSWRCAEQLSRVSVFTAIRTGKARLWSGLSVR